MTRLVVYHDETTYTQPAPFQRAVRGRRGDDVHAERCRRVGRDQAALGGVLGVHVVDFTSFLPKSRNWPPTPRKHGSGSSSPTRRRRAILAGPRPCHCPGTSPPTPRRARSTLPSAPARARVRAHRSLFIPRRRVGAPAPRPTRERDEPLDSTPTLAPAPLPCSGVRWGTPTTRWRATGSTVAAQGRAHAPRLHPLLQAKAHTRL